MHAFHSKHRDERMGRCKVNVAERPKRAASAEEFSARVQPILEQITKTLVAEIQCDAGKSLRISGAGRGREHNLSPAADEQPLPRWHDMYRLLKGITVLDMGRVATHN